MSNQTDKHETLKKMKASHMKQTPPKRLQREDVQGALLCSPSDLLHRDGRPHTFLHIYTHHTRLDIGESPVVSYHFLRIYLGHSNLQINSLKIVSSISPFPQIPFSSPRHRGAQLPHHVRVSGRILGGEPAGGGPLRHGPEALALSRRHK